MGEHIGQAKDYYSYAILLTVLFSAGFVVTEATVPTKLPVDSHHER